MTGRADGASNARYDAALSDLVNSAFASRLFAQDDALWGASHSAEAAIRLGWVDPFSDAPQIINEANKLHEQLAAKQIDRIVLCGMGGSSLAAEVIANFHHRELIVLDSTHPSEVFRALNGPLSRTAVLVSSKSGETIETVSHAKAFAEAFAAQGLNPVERIIFITDPGSPFTSHNADGYQVFLANPHIGGRYSALTAFGLIPAVIAGVDVTNMLAEAAETVSVLRNDSYENPAFQLAAAIYSAFPQRFVLCMHEDASANLGLSTWISQLVAESTGKDASGVLPIEAAGCAVKHASPNATAIMLAQPESPHNVTVELGQSITVTASLGAQFLLWEVATVALSRLIGVTPFDQPDVESSKQAARSALAEGALGVISDDDLGDASSLLTELHGLVTPNSYISIQAYLDRQSSAAERAYQLLEQLTTEFEVPVSLDWGPRYLHSVGQFHKGGTPNGIFVQLVDDGHQDVAIPHTQSSFRILLLSQASGDRQVLLSRGRPVIRRVIRLTP